jgi:allantoin racemase
MSKDSSMKLLYLMPGAGMPTEEVERRTNTAKAIARPDVDIEVAEVGEGPLSIESSIEEYMSISPLLLNLLELRKSGEYDAIIIGCAGDPGLAPARELMDIPIIGPAESSYLFACMISDRFSVLTPLHAGVESADRVRTRVREMGLESRLESIEFMQSSVHDLWDNDKDKALDDLRVGVQSAAQKGAGSVVLGCMSMAFHRVDESLSTPSMPIVNPLKVAIKTAETFVDLRIQHSRYSYPEADFEKLNATLFK